MRSSSRTPVIAGNWKMHKTIEEAVSFVQELIPLIRNAQAKVYIAVPYTSLRFAADAAKNSPIVIGAENMSDETEEVLNQQLEESLGDISAEQMAAIILAYEPVWAIGSGHSALPEEVEAMHHFCRQWVKQKWGEETAQKVIIQYGGSVHPNDAKDFMELPDVDGVLVGGASLAVESFNRIIHYSSVGN